MKLVVSGLFVSYFSSFLMCFFTHLSSALLHFFFSCFLKCKIWCLRFLLTNWVLLELSSTIYMESSDVCLFLFDVIFFDNFLLCQNFSYFFFDVFLHCQNFSISSSRHRDWKSHWNFRWNFQFNFHWNFVVNPVEFFSYQLENKCDMIW